MTGKIKVIYGSNDDTFSIEGASVKSVRLNLAEPFNIPDDALAFVNGEQVDETYILQAHDALEFCKQRGSKGICRNLAKAEIIRDYVGVPEAVLEKCFRAVPHHAKNAKGEPLWNEGVVDDWIKEYYRGDPDDGRDKVIPPDSVRIDGYVIDGLSAKQWRVFEAVINNDLPPAMTPVFKLEFPRSVVEPWSAAGA